MAKFLSTKNVVLDDGQEFQVAALTYNELRKWQIGLIDAGEDADKKFNALYSGVVTSLNKIEGSAEYTLNSLLDSVTAVGLNQLMNAFAEINGLKPSEGEAQAV